MIPFLWQNVSLRIFDGRGVEAGSFTATRFEGGPRTDVNESKHQGSERPNIIGIFMGGEGSMSIEIDTGSTNIENLVSQHIEDIKANSPNQFLTFVAGYDAPGGSQRGERFSRCVLTNPRKTIDSQSRLVLNMTWRAEDWNAL